MDDGVQSKINDAQCDITSVAARLMTRRKTLTGDAEAQWYTALVDELLNAVNKLQSATCEIYARDMQPPGGDGGDHGGAA